jgi:hypothetical protein
LFFIGALSPHVYVNSIEYILVQNQCPH